MFQLLRIAYVELMVREVEACTCVTYIAKSNKGSMEMTNHTSWSRLCTCVEGGWWNEILLPHMCTILINLCDLSSPWISCLILQYMWHKCMLLLLLQWAPHKLSLECRMKRGNALVRIYIHTERHERSYGEVKLWLVFVEILWKLPVI